MGADARLPYFRAMRYQRAEHPLKLDGLAAARAFFAGCFAESDPSLESLWVAHVDDRAHCLHVSHHAGDETGAQFPLRIIIADAVNWHCMFVGWLLAVGSTSNERVVANGQFGSQELEGQNKELDQRPAGEQATGMRETDSANEMTPTEDYANITMNADDVPEMNATNTDY
jgi:hypothetical protein